MKEELVGKTVICPCGQRVRVPAPLPAHPHGVDYLGPTREVPRPVSPPQPLLASPEPTPVVAVQGKTPRPAAVPPGEEDFSSLFRPATGPSELGWLGAYRVLRVLGQGGMGVVFLAEDTVLRRQVALKVLLPALAESEVARQRFVREARAVAMVQHDHIVPIHHVAEEAGLPFLVMPYLKGRLLGQVLVPGQPVAYPHILQIGREVALALAAAHSHGLIHRDIKPGNLWLETVDGRPEAFRVRVLDFGLARPVEACEGLTQTGMIVGSPGYMAPEQVDGLELDARADLFSLGCVLYLLATGQPAFPGDTLTAKVKALATRDPEAPHLANAAVPRPLSALILHLLVKQRDGRPASAIEVVRRLEEIGRDPTPPAPTPPLRKPLTAPPTPAATAPRRSLQRRRAPAPKPRVAPAAVSQLLLALLVFGVLLALLLHRTFGPAGKGSGRALQNPPQVAPVPALPDPE